MEKNNIAAARSPNKLAELNQDKPKSLPTVSEGYWDPELFSRYERATKTYVRQVNIDALDIVPNLLSGLQGIRIQNWYDGTHKEIDILTHEEFLALLKGIVLDPNWDVLTKNRLLAVKQNEREFNEYYWDVMAINNQLRGSPQHVRPTNLRPILENGMEPDLKRLALGPSIAGIQDDAEWLLKVCELDFTCHENRCAISDQVQKMIRHTAANTGVTPPAARGLTPFRSTPNNSFPT